MTNEVFKSYILDSDQWGRSVWFSRLTLVIAIVAMFSTYNGSGGDLDSIFDHLNVSQFYQNVSFYSGVILLILSFVIALKQRGKGTIQIDSSELTVVHKTFKIEDLKDLKIEFNLNNGKVAYGTRNHKTGGKNFLTFTHLNTKKSHEFFIETNVEEQKLRRIVDSWSTQSH